MPGLFQAEELRVQLGGNDVLQTGYAAKVVVIALKRRLVFKKSRMAGMDHRVVQVLPHANLIHNLLIASIFANKTFNIIQRRFEAHADLRKFRGLRFSSKDQIFGGGIDKELGAGTRIAGGIYYNYLQGVKSISVRETTPGIWSDYDSSDYPEHTEHQVIVRLAGEHEFTPSVALRMGLGFFYGWVEEDFENTVLLDLGFEKFYNDISLSGYHWGIGGSIGGTLTFNSFVLEPFFNVGWQQYDMDGDDGRTTGTAITTGLWDMDLSRSEWYIGGGCSFLFDLP